MSDEKIAENVQTDQSGGEPLAETKPANAPGGSGQTQKAATPIKLEFVSEEEHEAYLTGKLKERLAQKERQAQAREQKARQDAEAQALAEQGKFKELSESQGKRIAELEATAEELKAAQGQLKKYQQALSEYRDAQYAGIPDHIKALLEGRDILDQMAWLTANQEKLKPAAPPAEAKPPDINATQRGVPAGRQTDEQRREIAARLGVRPEFLPK